MHDTLRTIFEIALPLLLIMDPIGNLPVCLSILKNQPPERQRRILLREMLFALGIIVLFYFLGEWLMNMLALQQSTMRVAGGVILFIISMRMVFPQEHDTADTQITDPFIVPIAVPLIAGPSLLAAVMVYAGREEGRTLAMVAILAAWTVTSILMLAGSVITRLLGKRGMRAAERLMGLILILLSIQMLEDGLRLFISSL
ncbi:MAG: MarC family protein [Desulfovibrionaceae bacterium]|jgi:multiple antibiotic resistance protein|nr:MarC family protein [Desulfovibrionaceae bacterium]